MNLTMYALRSVLGFVLCYDDNQPEEAINIYDSLLADGFQDQALRDWLEAVTLVNMGDALMDTNKFKEAIAVFDQVADRFGGSDEPALLEQVARGLINKALAFEEMDKAEKAVAAYDEVISRFGESLHFPLRVKVAKALVNKGWALKVMGKLQEPVAVYDDALSWFSQSTELPLQELVAKILIYKARALDHIDKSEDAVAVDHDVVARFGQSTETVLQEKVAEALGDKDRTVSNRGRHQEGFDAWTRWYPGSATPRNGPFVWRWPGPFTTKASVLKKLGQHQEAIAV